MLLGPLGMWLSLGVAALVVAGLASYLYLSERSTERMRGVQFLLDRQTLTRMR
jgi:hypothetical protein